MASTANKNLLGFVVDASLSMSSMFLPDENSSTSAGQSKNKQSKLELVKNFINTYMCMRCADSKTIEFSVTTFGQDPTCNENHCHQLGTRDGYEHVHELFDMCHPGQDIYQLVQELQAGPADGAADVIPGLIVAFDSLVNAHKKHAYNRGLVLITDGEQRIVKSDEDFGDLKAVVGSASVADPDATSKRGPVPIHIILVGKCQPSRAAGGAAPDQKPNSIKLENAVLLKDTARRTGGTYIEAEDPGEMLWALSHGVGLGLRPQLNKTFLRFGGVDDGAGGMSASALDIPCFQWAMTQMKTPLYLHKKWDERVRSGGGGAHISAAGGGGDADDSSELGVRNIQRDITYMHPDDPQSEITIDSFVEGYKYGEYYVPVDSGNREAMRLECHAGLDVIGFVRSSEVPRHHFMDVCWVVQGNDLVAESQVGVAALARAMRTQGKMLLARRVNKENDDPHLVALVSPTVENGTLLMYRIPCADDSRFYSFPSIPDVNRGKKRQRYGYGVDALADFVDLLTVPQIPDIKLTPSNAGNYRMFSAVVSRMLGQSGYSSGAAGNAVSAADQLQVPLVDLVSVPHDLQRLHKAATSVSEAFQLSRPKEKRFKKDKQYFSTLQIQEETRRMQAAAAAASSQPVPSSSSAAAAASSSSAAAATAASSTSSAKFKSSVAWTSPALPAPPPSAYAASTANDYLTKIIQMPHTQSAVAVSDSDVSDGLKSKVGHFEHAAVTTTTAAKYKALPSPDAEAVVENFTLSGMDTELFNFSQSQGAAATATPHTPVVKLEPSGDERT